jgi:crossover junction endodeoxyribonuclease RusA
LIEIVVHGLPRPQGSKRHVGNGIMREASAYVGEWRQDVAAAAARQYQGPPLGGPLFLEIEFRFPRPKAHFGTGKRCNVLKSDAPLFVISRKYGDLSKLIRSTEDAISATSGFPVVADDSLFVQVLARKVYASEECPAGAVVKVSRAA